MASLKIPGMMSGTEAPWAAQAAKPTASKTRSAPRWKAKTCAISFSFFVFLLPLDFLLTFSFSLVAPRSPADLPERAGGVGVGLLLIRGHLRRHPRAGGRGARSRSSRKPVSSTTPRERPRCLAPASVTCWVRNCWVRKISENDKGNMMKYV